TTDALNHGAGGLFNTGTATITQSTFSGNTASAGVTGGDGGGAMYNSGSATLNLTNDTLSDNSAAGNGGGIYNIGIANTESCTIANNKAAIGGGGVYNEPGPTAPVAVATSFGANGPALGFIAVPSGSLLPPVAAINSAGNVY